MRDTWILIKKLLFLGERLSFWFRKCPHFHQTIYMTRDKFSASAHLAHFLLHRRLHWGKKLHILHFSVFHNIQHFSLIVGNWVNTSITISHRHETVKRINLSERGLGVMLTCCGLDSLENSWLSEFTCKTGVLPSIVPPTGKTLISNLSYYIPNITNTNSPWLNKKKPLAFSWRWH